VISGGCTMQKIFGIILIVFLSTTTITAQETVQLTTGEWAPLASRHLKNYGPISQIISLAFESQDIKVTYHFFPWKRSYDQAKRGVFDGTILWRKENERMKDFYFTDPISEGAYYFFHLKEYQFDWNNIGDLKRIPIGGTIGYFYGIDMDDAEKQGRITVSRNSSDLTNFKKILNGRIKLFPMGIDVGLYMLRKNFKPKEIKQFTYHPKVVDSRPYHVLISKALPLERAQRLANSFNLGLKKIKEDGTYDRIMKASRAGEYEKE
jgi:polar amino acid transport system substrate-binding protein